MAPFRNLEVSMKRPVKPRSWFGILGSVALSVTLAMTACGGDGDDGDDGSGGGNGGNTTAGNGGTAPATSGGTQAAGGTQAGSTGGTSSSTGGVPSSGGVAGRQQLPNLRKNTAPSAN
jgi:hypothetical protein